MNCDEIRLLAGDAIDRELGKEKRSAFFEHLKACLPCRNDYELELLGKRILRQRLRSVPTPTEVSQKILVALRDKEIPESSRWLTPFSTWRFLAPALGSIFITFLLISLFTPWGNSTDESIAHTAENDIIRQSLSNFALVKSGELKPSMIACYSDVVIGYFQEQDAKFAVSVVSDDSCDWFGGLTNTYEGIKLAHIIYKRGDDILYVYEVQKEEALRGSALSLPTAAKQSLTETGWYTDPEHEDCNVVLWTVNETLCAAVSTMKKDRLLAFLTPR